MSKLCIHVLQHSEGTPPGSLLEWGKMRGHELKVVQVYKGDPLPGLSDTDWLIILGGPMNVDDTHEHVWLAGEKALIKHAVEKKKPCLGLCLGGQLLAQALGGAVRKHEHWEVGWHTIILGSSPEPTRQSERLTVFQFHQDTFDLPPGAVRVAANKITENQAFAFGDHVVGLQFQPEATEEWVKECSEEKDYPSGPHVQTPEQLMEGVVFITPMKKWFFTLLDRMESIAKVKASRP